MNLFEMKKQRQAELERADAIVGAAERGNRALSSDEQKMFDSAIATASRLASQIEAIEAKNTIRGMNLIPGSGNGSRVSKPQPKTLSHDYVSELFACIKSGGHVVGAALSEGADGLGGYAVPTLNAGLRIGSNAAGGYAEPVIVDQNIVPLAPQEMAIRKLATVLPTVADVKIPTKATKGTAAAKAEGDGTGANVFGGTAPTLGQVTLSAFMAGDILDVSWEALEDIVFFEAFATDDIINAVNEYEEPKFISGTGSGQPQGVLTGADTTTAVSGVSLDGIYDLVATLKGLYHPRAAFLMQRATGLFIRKLQRQANLFEPVWTRVNGQDYLLGYPVEFSDSMPAHDAAAGQKPIVFGDFKAGYVIGDRGGSGIRVKVLDQPKAAEGITQLLAYRRTDGRVRRSEALKAYVLA